MRPEKKEDKRLAARKMMMEGKDTKRGLRSLRNLFMLRHLHRGNAFLEHNHLFCGFHRADSIVGVPSCPFHRFRCVHSIERIPSWAFLRANAYFIVRILSRRFYHFGFTVQILLCGSIVRIPLFPSSAFH